MSKPIEITSVAHWNNTLREAKEEGKTIIVDFHADWCGPCKAIAPKYAQLAKDFSYVTFLRVDVDRQAAIAKKYQIAAMPTFLAIHGGTVSATIKGADPNGLTNLVAHNAGPNPPVKPLPEAAEKEKELGNTAFKAGDHETAIAHYTTAIFHSPTSSLLYSNRSLAYLKQATPVSIDAALADAEQAISLTPTWGKAHVRKGDALLALGKTADAVNAFAEAVKVSGKGTVGSEAKKKQEEAKKILGWH